jgi:hypothetical protein
MFFPGFIFLYFQCFLFVCFVCVTAFNDASCHVASVSYQLLKYVNRDCVRSGVTSSRGEAKSR